MSEWKEYKISELCELIGGGTPKTSVPEYWNGNIPWLSVTDFNTGRKFCFDAEKKITEKGLKESSTKILKKGQIIISARGTVGVISMLGNDMAFNQSNYGIDAKKEFTTNDFLYYLLRDNIAEFLSASYGAVFDTITKETFNQITVSLPPLPEQTAIAEVLSSLDDKIDLLHRQNKTLEQLAETLFRNENEKWKTKSEKLVSFGELVKPKRGKNITKENAIEGEFPVVAGGLEPSCYHNESNTLEPVITVSSSGANAGFVRLYHSPVWASDCSYIDRSITPYVFFSYVFMKINQQILFDKQEGSAQPHVYPSHIMDLEISNFPEKLIDEFEKSVSPYFQKIKSNTTQIRTLTQLRDTLLPKLMSGEVRVRLP